MGLMQSVKQQQRKKCAPKGIIYGGPGVGKTTFAALAPGHFFIDVENGANWVRDPATGKRIDVAKTPYLETWEGIEQWLESFEKDDHGYKILVVDTLDWLVRRLEEHVTGVSKGQYANTLTGGKFAFGVGKRTLKNYIYRSVLPSLDRVVERGIAVILLAHTARDEFVSEDGAKRQKACPDIEDCISVFSEWVDFLCLARKTEAGERYMITEDTDYALAKNRYGLPSKIEFKWSTFADAVAASINTESKKEVANNGGN